MRSQRLWLALVVGRKLYNLQGHILHMLERTLHQTPQGHGYCTGKQRKKGLDAQLQNVLGSRLNSTCTTLCSF